MIKLTRLNGSEIVVNAELIETIEATPDTVITLTTDHKWVMRDSVDEVIAKVVAYKQEIHTGLPRRLGD